MVKYWLSIQPGLKLLLLLLVGNNALVIRQG